MISWRDERTSIIPEGKMEIQTPQNKTKQNQNKNKKNT
jgi:hypothetical protein